MWCAHGRCATPHSYVVCTRQVCDPSQHYTVSIGIGWARVRVRVRVRVSLCSGPFPFTSHPPLW